MNQLYPLKFRPILKETIWGGNKLGNLLHKSVKAGSKVGESWEISGVEGNVSVVTNGFLKNNSLEELAEVYMGDLVGDKIYDQFGTEFPLLIKFIDATDVLSIQVHPNDELAAERHNSFGKTEMWYVMESDPGAELISGFNKKIDKETYLEHFNHKTLKEILNSEKAEKGDVFFIPAGRVHAIGKGILLAEIQQTSNITYRIYDWDRVDAQGKGRELHTGLAVDAIDYNFYPDYKTVYHSKPNQPTTVVECNYFTTNVLQFDKIIDRDYFKLDSFVIYICTEGEAKIDYSDKESIKISQGESILLPAVLKDIRLEPIKPTTLLEVYIK